MLNNYEDKAKRPLLTFVSMSLICPISNERFPSQSAPKELLESNKNVIFIMELYKSHEIGRNQQRVFCKAKHKPFIFGIMIPSWFSKIILGFSNMVAIFCRDFVVIFIKNGHD